MSVAKSSITRMTKSAEEDTPVVKTGIVTHAPEVPEGDAAPLPKEKKTRKKAKEDAPVTEPAPAAVPAKPAAKTAPKSEKTGGTFVRIGDPMPYYLL